VASHAASCAWVLPRQVWMIRSMDSPQPDSEVELDVEAEVTDVTPAAAVLDD